jgi:hypothetical protein
LKAWLPEKRKTESGEESGSGESYNESDYESEGWGDEAESNGGEEDDPHKRQDEPPAKKSKQS